MLTRAIALVLALAALAGCGSSRDLPPAAEPAEPRSVAVVDGGRAIAVLSTRERVLDVYDRDTRKQIAHAPAGVGPTQVVAGRDELIYVLDRTGQGLLVFELRPHLHIKRRLAILGSPSGIAADPVNRRLWVTTTAPDRLLELTDGARPHRVSSLDFTGHELPSVDARDR